MGLIRRKLLGTCVMAGLGLVWAAGPALAGPEDEAKAIVAKAIALYDEKGEAALQVFNEGAASGFLAGEIYIVVESRGPDGKVLAHAAAPKMIGTPLAQIADPTGKKFAVIMSMDATEAGGWFDYQWPDPTTGKLGQKKSWAVLHKDFVFIAGFYVH